MKRAIGPILFYAAPAIAQAARLAGLPPSADGLLGALVLVTQVAGLAVATHRFARGLALGDAVETFLAAACIFLVVPAAVVSWLGAVGLARPLPVLVACGAIAAALHLLAREPAAAPAREEVPLRRIEVALAAFATLAVAAMALRALREATRDADSVWYHLTTAAEIVRTGSIRPDPILTENALGYPGMREAIVAWLALPLRSENLAILFPVEIAAAAAALYALARSFGIARAPALGAVAILSACPLVATAAIEQKNDLFLGAAFLLTWRFLREAARSGQRRHAVLAGLAAGLLVGAKFAGVILFAALLVTWAFADLLSAGGFATARRRGGVIAVTLATALGVAGVWYARNLVLFHNPFYPKHVALLGHTVFPGLPTLDKQLAMTVLGLDPVRTIKFAGQFLAGLGPAAALGLVPPLAAPIAARRGIARFTGGAWIWLGILPAALFVIYAWLPYSVHPKGTTYWYVQPRFLIGFFAATSLGLAALVPERGRAHDAGVAILAALAAGGAALWMPKVALVVAVALAAAAAWIPIERASTALSRLRVPRALAIAALVPAAFGAARLDALRERIKDDPVHGYRADPVEGWGDVSMWVRRNVARSRILYTGTIQMFPLYGPGFTNTLFWVKTDPRHDDVEDLYRAAREHDVDYIVSFSPVKLRYGARGERFAYGPSPTLAIRDRHPGSVELAFASGHADVVRVLKPAAAR